MSIINQLEERNKWSFISEDELKDIYEFQYNDVFSKILLLNGTQFMNVLEKQIIAYLYIIKKQPILSYLSNISQLYIQKYYQDREKVYQAYLIIKNMSINELEYLDKLNCYIHCPNCSEALHNCGNKFILCNDFIFCTHCKKVYNENQAKMFCDFCKLDYYTKLREIDDERYENYFPVSLKCKNCNELLYADISISKNKEKIENLFCKKCKINENFSSTSEIKLYNEFNKLKTDQLCIIHTLLKRKFAIPKNKKRNCKCKIENNKKYKHIIDNGNLLEGLRQGKKVIICDKCFKIYEYKEFDWKCPQCELGFNEYNSKYNTTVSNNKIKGIFSTKNNNKIIEKENKNNNNINSNRIKENKKYYYKINISEENQINKPNNTLINNINNSIKFKNNFNDNNNNKTCIMSFNGINTKENKDNMNNNKSKRIISSKLYTQENKSKLNNEKERVSIENIKNENKIKYNNYNNNESKNIIKKGNSKGKKKELNENNKIKRNSGKNNIIKINFEKNENNNLTTAKSSINIHSINSNQNINNNKRNIQIKNEKNKNIKSPRKKENENIKIEIIKRNYSLDKNDKEIDKRKYNNINNKNSIPLINNKIENIDNNNIILKRRIKINEIKEEKENKNYEDKVIQRNKGSPNHKRVDIIETSDKKKNKMNNIQNINLKYSHDFGNLKNNINKEIKEPLIESINIINHKEENIAPEKKEKIIQEKLKLVENRYNNFNENIKIDNVNNILINDKVEIDKKKEGMDKEQDKGNNIEKKEIIKTNDKKEEKKEKKKVDENSEYISSEGYQFNCDNYNVVQLLGEGTFGKIYLVEDPDDLKKYALKKISVSDMDELNDNKKESELLMKLSQENPSLNVVKIFGIQVKKLDKFNLVMYVLMEAAQCDWENEIRNRSQYQAYYTEEELMKILLNLTTTLASLQKMGICHRDVKPQNILCFDRDNYKLSDFGEAKKKKKRKINGNFIYDFEGDTSKQTVRGTELYMSPILFKALHDCPEVDLEYNAYKSDVFSLGLCMLLSSTLGFQALYDIRELYDNSKVKKIVDKYLSVRYSKDYVKLISSMLQIKEKNRPDFIELENYIQHNYYHKENIKEIKEKK